MGPAEVDHEICPGVEAPSAPQLSFDSVGEVPLELPPLKDITLSQRKALTRWVTESLRGDCPKQSFSKMAIVSS